MDKKEVIMVLDQLLDERNIDRNQLCKDLKISKATLDRYCQNDIRYLDSNFLIKICYYLKCDINDIIVYKDK